MDETSTHTQTTVDLAGGDFWINGNPTFPGREFGGLRIEGLLPNARMIQGFFDYRMKGEDDFREGYQSMPCDWGIRSARKRGFFGLLKEMTGEA